MVLLSLAPAPARPVESGDPLATYGERYQHLIAKDVPARLALAQWCKANKLFHQEAELLREVLAIQPGHTGAYRGLLAADARRTMPVDKAWAAKLETLLGANFKLYHSPHFTILSDFEDDTAGALGEVMEDAYRSLYDETMSLGLRPMPPDARLVCILFRRYDDYADYAKRDRGKENTWAAGYYSLGTNRTAFYHSMDNPAFEEQRQQLAEIEQRTDELLDELDRTTRKANRSRILVELRRLDASQVKLADQLGATADFATDATTRHETTHQLFYNSGLLRRDRAYPFWLNEGLATNFELCDKEGRAGPGFISIRHLNAYRRCKKAGELMNLVDLLTDHPADDADREWVRGRYVEAWALVHFLWNRRPNEFRDYLINLDQEGTPRDGVAFFRAHFGDDLQGVEREFRRYVDSLHF
ncbi:MAG TPA: DUF1570 domain-containing protein [Tepidisphaeraceae bacterium]|nr:DUF1570 domain-containing protein [Tepidisphaeraceae bacterium]